MVDWPGLLKWSLKYSDGTTFNKDLKPLDPETRKWLEEALEEYTFNEIKKMQEIAEKLEKPENPDDPKDEDNRLLWLDELLDLVEGLENARDFVKIGKFPVLVQTMLHSQYPEVRKQAYILFSACNLNNTFVQMASLQYGGLNLMNSIIKEETLANKEGALSALTSILKGDCLDIKRNFIEAEGIEFLLEIIKNDAKYNSAKMRTKTITTLSEFVYYDDKYIYPDMAEYNRSNNLISGHLALDKKEEAKFDVYKPKMPEELAKFKDIAKNKLIENGFIDHAFKFLDTNNFKSMMDLRPSLFSILITLIQYDSKLKLKEDKIEILKQFLTKLEEESKKQGDLYETEVDVLKSLLALHK